MSSPSLLSNAEKVEEVFVGGGDEVEFCAQKDGGEEKVLEGGQGRRWWRKS